MNTDDLKTKAWKELTHAEKAHEMQVSQPQPSSLGNRKLRRKLEAMKRRANRKARKGN